MPKRAIYSDFVAFPHHMPGPFSGFGQDRTVANMRLSRNGSPRHGLTEFVAIRRGIRNMSGPWTRRSHSVVSIRHDTPSCDLYARAGPTGGVPAPPGRDDVPHRTPPDLRSRARADRPAPPIRRDAATGDRPVPPATTALRHPAARNPDRVVRRPVSRVLCATRQSRIGDGHSSGTPVARRLVRSTRTRDRRLSCPCGLRPYPTLLPAGLAVPLPSPAARWALTPPFHPCPLRGRSVLCGAFPEVPALPDRPSPGVTRRRAFAEPGLSSRRRRATIRPPDAP